MHAGARAPHTRTVAQTNRFLHSPPPSGAVFADCSTFSNMQI